VRVCVFYSSCFGCEDMLSVCVCVLAVRQTCSGSAATVRVIPTAFRPVDRARGGSIADTILHLK